VVEHILEVGILLTYLGAVVWAIRLPTAEEEVQRADERK